MSTPELMINALEFVQVSSHFNLLFLCLMLLLELKKLNNILKKRIPISKWLMMISKLLRFLNIKLRIHDIVLLLDVFSITYTLTGLFYNGFTTQSELATIEFAVTIACILLKIAHATGSYLQFKNESV